MAAALVGLAWVYPVARLPVRPERRQPRRRQGQGRRREARRRTPRGDLLRRRVRSPGDLGRAAAAVRPSRRCDPRATRSGRSPRLVVRGPAPGRPARDGPLGEGRGRRRAESRPGIKVSATPRGALVEAVATDAPAAAKLDEGDVIVGAGGKRDPDASGASRVVHGRPPRQRRRAPRPPPGIGRDVDGTHRGVAQPNGAGRSSGSASGRRPTSSCR